jgi:hypothetical protein
MRPGRPGELVDPKRVKRAKNRLRQLTSRRWGASMERRIKEIEHRTHQLRCRRCRARTSAGGYARVFGGS